MGGGKVSNLNLKKKYVYDTSDSTNYKLAFKKLKEIAGLQNGIFSYLFYGVFLEEYTSFSILPPNFLEYCSFSRTSGLGGKESTFKLQGASW